LRDRIQNIGKAADFAVDPGDENLLAQAVNENPVFPTKDHDIGTLVYRDLRHHCGLLLVDDLGSASAESALILAALSVHVAALTTGAFPRAGPGSIREAKG